VLRSARSFGVEAVNDAGKRGVARLLSQAQTINASNQSQRLLFEMDNTGGGFKIGEFVTIRVQSAQGTRGLSVPNAAISEMNGKPVVFIKGRARSRQPGLRDNGGRQWAVYPNSERWSKPTSG